MRERRFISVWVRGSIDFDSFLSQEAEGQIPSLDMSQKGLSCFQVRPKQGISQQFLALRYTFFFLIVYLTCDFYANFLCT